MSNIILWVAKIRSLCRHQARLNAPEKACPGNKSDDRGKGCHPPNYVMEHPTIEKKAMKLFEESLPARRKVQGYAHLDVTSPLYSRVESLKCFEEDLKIQSEEVAITYEKIGKLAREMGDTTKAQNALEEALRIRKNVHGGTHEAVATVLQELGELMNDNANYSEAMDKYFEALNIRQNLFGNDHVAVAETFYSMGYTLQNQDSLNQALDCFNESLNIQKVQLGLDSKEVGDTLNMMGFLQAKLGLLDDALSLLFDALRIRKLQEDQSKVSETLKNIGDVHREKMDHELAIECYEECLRIRRSKLGDLHEKVADALIAMGIVQSDMGLPDKAMRSYLEALTIRTYLFGEHSDSVGDLFKLQKIGYPEFQNGEYEKAMSMLTEFIQISQENDSENGDYVYVLFMIGNIHKMQRNEEEAKKWWTYAYNIFQKLGLSEGNPQVAEVMVNLLRQENVLKSSGLFGRQNQGLPILKSQGCF